MFAALLQRRLVRSSLMLGFFTLAAKFAGLWRDRVLASRFGAGTELDVYYSAFRIPDLVFNLLVLGALSAAFIPVFIEYRQRDHEEGWDVTRHFISAAVVVTFVACVIVAVFARPLSYLVAPGFDVADRTLLVTLLRIMLLSPLIFAISSSIGSVLQSLERFVAYSLAPIFYNFGIIIGAWYLVPLVHTWGFRPAVGLALGVVLGALLHLIVQLPSVSAAGFRFHVVFNTSHEGLRRIIRLMAPRTLALGAYQIGQTVVNAFASVLGTGSITVLNLATNLQYLPVSIVGISVATAVFPRLSSHASAQEREHFQEKFSQAMGYTFWGVLVVAVAMYFLREPIVRIYVGSGAFTPDDMARTAAVTAAFLIGTIPQSLVHIVARAFYALQDTRTPLVTSLAGIVVTLAGGAYAVFVLKWGVTGLALASSLGMYVYFGSAYLLLRRRL